MRQVINISLPEQMLFWVDEALKSGKYATKSEFFRSLLRDWSEKNLVNSLKKSREELKSGNGVLLKSLKDLRD